VQKKTAFRHYSGEEKEFLAKWHEEGKTPTEIAELGRDLSSVFRHVKAMSSKKKAKPVGRPPSLSSKEVDRIVSKAKDLIKVADSKYQVTASMIRTGARLTCCVRTVLDALHSRGLYLHPMREKPVRTEEDEQCRLEFATTYGAKPLSSGLRDGLAKGHVKPRKNPKVNFGKSVMIAAAISGSKVLVWHKVEGQWDAVNASLMYGKLLAPALRKAKPNLKRKFLVLEDNAPSGYKSKLAIATKLEHKINVLELPRRSPDLNPLAYGFWAELNKRMRKQELTFRDTKKETRDEYIERLRQTATRMPAKFCKALVCSLKRRCVDLRAAEGRDFQECVYNRYNRILSETDPCTAARLGSMADYNSNDEDEEALAILREREEEDLSAASAGAKQVSPAANAGASSDERPSLPARLGEAAAASASAVLPFEYNSNDEDEDDEALAILRERDEEDWYAAAAGAAAASASAVGSLPAPLLTLSLGSPGEQAVAAEAWSELVGLDSDARRQHLHWTHVRTGSPSDRQPDSFTGEGFWIHLCQVYREVFPEAANASGSILLFGAVAKELHAHAVDEAVRREHHHAPCYCSKRHAWKALAEHSHSVYNVKLHAACHEGYASMYTYITCPSAKKPLSELDPEVFLSQEHPRGQVLRRLLEAGATRAQAVSGRRRKASRNGPEVTKRFRSGDVYGLVASSGVRTALQLQALAAAAASEGDQRMAEFCTSVGEVKLTELVQSAVAVLEAPRTLALRASSRMELLRRAAFECDCTCQNLWTAGAARVLVHNNQDVTKFCQDVCRALGVGACRGVNMAIVGEPGCGKSMLFESLDLIYSVIGKPEARSSFPLAGVLDAHILLWQDYRHNDSSVLFEDFLSLVAGERMDIRVPHKRNVSHRNTAPLFYSSNSQLVVARPDPAETVRLNRAMEERFCFRRFVNPIPEIERLASFPRTLPLGNLDVPRPAANPFVSQDSRRVTDPQTLLQESFDDIGYEVQKKTAFRHYSGEEKEFLAKWHEEGKTTTEIAELLGRDLSSVFRHVKAMSSKKKAKPVGRPPSLSSKEVDCIVSKAKDLIKVADSKYQVTASMIRTGARLTCCVRTVLDALHSRGLYLHPMREKPDTEEDEQCRLEFATTYGAKPLSFWAKTVDAYLDNKWFPVYLNARGRAYAAKRTARGSFRSPGDGLAKGHVKPRKNPKVNFGKSVMISAAISGSKVLVWHKVEGQWDAVNSSLMYGKLLAPALRKAKPNLKRKFLQELTFRYTKKETRDEYIERLRQTATRMPAKFCKALVCSLKRRCVDLRAAEGRDFQE
ncbi:unnamed protein product, partial [Polarella glacialis]